MNDVDKRIKDFLDRYHMRDRGKYFRKERWVSFCSAHQTYNKECRTCNAGIWRNVWMMNISSFVYKKSPTLWKWCIEKGIFK